MKLHLCLLKDEEEGEDEEEGKKEKKNEEAALHVAVMRRRSFVSCMMADAALNSANSASFERRRLYLLVSVVCVCGVTELTFPSRRERETLIGGRGTL